MAEALVLNALVYLPLAGLLAILLVPRRREGAAKWIALAATTIQLGLGCLLYARFDGSNPGLQFVTDLPWIAAWGVHYIVGLDGLNLLLVLLTVFLGPLVVLGSFTAIRAQIRLFYSMLLLVQFAMLGTFAAQDLFLFFVFWEAMVVPMFFIIGIWGGERRVYATMKFVLYTAAGSILMLAAAIYLVVAGHAATGSFSFAFEDLYRLALPFEAQAIMFAAFAIAFAIKVPMVPLHTWLPDAHVEAPTAGSVVLAGVLLKMGTYGFLKLGLPLFPDAVRAASPALMALSTAGILYGACLALVQTDIKKIVAYSSISHLGYVMLGLFSFSLLAVQGAVIQMISHGLVAGGLFLMVGMIYERRHTRDLAAYGGLAKIMPIYSVFFMLLTLASIGLPATSGFTGEFMVLLGSFTESLRVYRETGATLPLAASAAAIAGVAIGALYMLWLAERFLFGKPRVECAPPADLGRREKLILGAIVAAIFWIGLYPQPLLEKTEPAVHRLLDLVAAARADDGGAP